MIQFLIPYCLIVLCPFPAPFDDSNSAVLDLQETQTSHSLDTMKYKGYRLDMTNFVVLKAKKDWVMLRFDAINSGREDLDFSKENHGDWVLLNFDPSFEKENLGKLRDNVRFALAKSKLQFGAGTIRRNIKIKVSILPLPRRVPTPPVSAEFEENIKRDTISIAKPDPPKPLKDTSTFVTDQPCPDIFFKDIAIISQNNRTATIQYTVSNKGKGAFILIHKGTTKTPSLVIRAFISGVPTLSRGAIPISDHVILDGPGLPHQLESGKSFSGTLELDVRKKTRYLKSLILSLDSDQFHLECDKTNNTGAVVLE